MSADDAAGGGAGGRLIRYQQDGAPGRLGDAIPLYERTLADREQVLHLPVLVATASQQLGIEMRPVELAW